jgi:hypothetical protein
VTATFNRYAQAMLREQCWRRHSVTPVLGWALVLGWLVAINQGARLGAQNWVAGTLEDFSASRRSGASKV